jgi:DNA modification methylase
MEETAPVLHDRTEYPLEIWQEWARPVWLNTRETNVLNAKVARDENAERHLCPMPLDLTERIVRQYSNPGDVVLSPFMGIGSEGYVALRCGRKFVGMELSSAYYSQAVKYLTEVEAAGGSNNLFARMAGECS